MYDHVKRKVLQGKEDLPVQAPSMDWKEDWLLRGIKPRWDRKKSGGSRNTGWGTAGQTRQAVSPIKTPDAGLAFFYFLAASDVASPDSLTVSAGDIHNLLSKETNV